MPTTVLLAHSLDLYLIAAHHVLDTDPDHQVVARVSTRGELLYAVPNLQPQVVCLNRTFSPDADLFTLLRELHALLPALKIIVSGQVLNGLFVRDLFAAGGNGYLWECDALSACLLPAVRTVLRNRPYLSPTANAEYLVAMQSSGRDWGLDDEARTVLHRLAQGDFIPEIAAALEVTPRRIYWVRQKLRQRFNAQTNEHLIALATAEGFI